MGPQRGKIMLKTKVEKRITAEEAAEIVATVGMSKSARIKELWDGGLGIKEISSAMGIIYNHSYNVIQNYILVNGIEVTRAARATGAKRMDIEAVLLEGKTNMEAAAQFKVAYNRVWKIKNDMIKAGLIEETPKRITITSAPVVVAAKEPKETEAVPYADEDLAVLGEVL